MIPASPACLSGPAEADGAVAVRVLAGDVDAYAVLVDRHQSRVAAAIARLLILRSDLEDLVQQTFVRAYETLDRYDPALPFGPWVATIAQRLAANHLRSRGREHGRRQRLQAILAQATSALSGDNDHLLDALRVCHDHLSGPAREVIRLYYAEGLDHVAIAARTNRTPGATQRLLSRLRACLRDCIRQRLVSA